MGPVSWSISSDCEWCGAAVVRALIDHTPTEDGIFLGRGALCGRLRHAVRRAARAYLNSPAR